VSVGAVSSYTFENVTQDHTIHASFVIKTYTITATAGANGTITPSGEAVVEHGQSQQFTITPDKGYRISDVLVNGVSVGAVSSYTFENVTQDHTIHASFVIRTYTITATASSGGSIIPSGEIVVKHGSEKAFSITPNTGFDIQDVLVNGTSQGPVESYVFSEVVQNHYIHALFARQPATLIIRDAVVSADDEVSITVGARNIYETVGMTLVIELDPTFFEKAQQYVVKFLSPLEEAEPVVVWSNKIPEETYVIDLSFGLKNSVQILDEIDILRLTIRTKEVSGSTALSFSQYLTTTNVVVETAVLDGSYKEIEPLLLTNGVITIQ
ncbi:MAG: Uncharacterized protein XE05_0996, partial [Thermotogales bacterium 46_20]